MLTERQYSNHRAYIIKNKKPGWYEYLAGLSHSYKPKPNLAKAHDTMLTRSAEYRAGYEYRPRGPGRPKLPKKSVVAGEKRPVGRPRTREGSASFSVSLPREIYEQLVLDKEKSKLSIRELVINALIKDQADRKGESHEDRERD